MACGAQLMSKHGEFLQAMLEYAEARGLQVVQVGIAFRGKRPDYCIVDDDLQPYDLQPTEETKMLPITSSQRGLLRSLIASFGLSAYTEASSYGHPMQIQPEPQLIANTRNSKRKHPVSGGSHKQNLRASKRNGKQYKVRKQA